MNIDYINAFLFLVFTHGFAPLFISAGAVFFIITLFRKVTTL